MSGVTSSGNGLLDILNAVSELSQTQVLVGVPHGEARTDGDGMTNAQIGYLLETGSPAMNLPPRPFLAPGVAAVQEVVSEKLINAAHAAFDGKPQRMQMYLKAAGSKAMSSVQLYFVEGSFAPLSIETIKARARRGRSGAKKYLKQMKLGPPEAGLVKPLIDTGQLRKSVTYIIKEGDKEVGRAQS
ncbi:hypothetical protein ACLDXX_04695 [Acinetobacter baumannii]